VLHLILENISELVVDDRWLHGQIVLMGEMFDAPPGRAHPRRAGKPPARRHHRQGAIKVELSDAQARLKEMLARFVDHLSEFSDSTGELPRQDRDNVPSASPPPATSPNSPT
jgi:diguanylate cyclase